MGTRLKRFLRRVGEPVQNLELFQRAWDECIELQQTEKVLWIGNVLIALGDKPRVELALMDGERVIGGAVLATEFDCHVGECITVCTQYVLPEFRHRGASALVMREARATAIAWGVKTIAWTHRVGDWKYNTLYRRIA